ncbi:hypothetical protein CISIN_1g035167mg [Citrus sinensis]|uniref:Uncharacterized protein n=1 Tax=Citrus sinensis TaxID=2711 RepID=A0A067DFM8_CITSI|nr:hypothetical protein CISIN_1g035167mg [Citrus sinensis]
MDNNQYFEFQLPYLLILEQLKEKHDPTRILFKANEVSNSCTIWIVDSKAKITSMTIHSSFFTRESKVYIIR